MAANDWLLQTNQQLNSISSQLQDQSQNIQALSDAILRMQMSKIPKYLTQEYAFSANDQTVRVNRQTNNIVLVRSVLFQFTSADAGTPATLTIGDKTWSFTSVPTTPVNWLGLELVVKPSDSIVITQKSTGAISLILMGEDLGENGVW